MKNVWAKTCDGWWVVPFDGKLYKNWIYISKFINININYRLVKVILFVYLI